MLDYIDKKFFKLALSGPFKETDLDIAVKCPICGDSRHKKSSKRLHLFYKDKKTRVKCFNGGCKLESTHTLGYFLKLYYPHFFEAYKREKFDIKIQSIKRDRDAANTEKSESFVNSQIKQNITKVETCKTCETAELARLLQCLTPINADTLRFLESRKLDYNVLKPQFGAFYSGTKEFLRDGKCYDLRRTLFIPIFLQKERELRNIIGFYARDIKEKRFVNNGLTGHFIPWNLGSCDNSKPIYIFEAILDALSFYTIYGESNVIALCTNNINPKILDYIKHPRFCLDNDTVGIQTMLKHTKLEKADFIIYSTHFKDFNEMLVNGYEMPLEFECGFKADLKLRKLL